MAKIMRVMTVIASVVFIGVFVLIIGHVAGLFQTTPQIKPGDEKYKVPNLVGMTLKQAEDACEEAGLVLSIVREEESEQYEKDYIFKQLTADGVRLPEGTKVQVYLSTGLKTIEIPDVANKSESEAITELVNAGFAKKNIKIRTENHDTVAEKKVTRTSPEAGKDGNKNSKITVYVSKGVGQTTMPSLVGRTKSEAEKALKDAGLKSQIEEVNSEEPAGQVIAQDIEEGTVLDRMTTVKYMVSAGKVKVKIPENEEFAGKTYREVVALLEEISGEFTFLDPPKRTVSAKYNKDFVVRVEQAGETVDEDATITIVLSNGPGPGTENGGATQ